MFGAALSLTSCNGVGDPGVAVVPLRVVEGKPQRIVSLNLCTDQLLMQMVSHDRIRALTYLATDPQSSGMVEEARLLPVTTGVAEQVISLDPDLVLAGTFSTRNTVAIMRRLGYNVVEFEPESDFGGIRRNIRKMAAAVGDPERGEEMIREIDAELARAPDAPRERPIYANYNANGFTSGNGSLITEVANLAGFETLGQSLGFAGSGQISLEQILVSRPDLIDLGDEYETPALATENFRHPILQRLMREQQTINLASNQTVCGTMLTLKALRTFVDARRRLL